MRRFCFPISILALAAASHAADFTADFNKTTNPGTTGWTYGLETALGGALTTYDTNVNNPSGYDAWYSSANHSSDLTPVVFLNQGTSTINGDAPGQAGLHPGPTGQFSVARYTVAAASSFAVSGMFYAGDSGTLNEYVLVDGVTKFSALATGTDQPFSFSFVASKGDTVDFVVGADAHGYTFDTTPLSATIKATPEPTSLAALGLGAVALLRRRRR